jgi:hypothetical protein
VYESRHRFLLWFVFRQSDARPAEYVNPVASI